jgi:salicylate 5-hydroxylase small subunit
MREPAALADVSRSDVEELYGSYYDSLDEMRLSDWPLHFAEECLYRLVSRENFERGLRLSTMVAESRGMLIDRVTGLTKTQVYAPRYYRRFPGPLRLGQPAAGRLGVHHNLLMVQTLIDKQSEIVLSARCQDQLVVEGGKLLIRERIVVFDSEMIPNSIIYPA